MKKEARLRREKAINPLILTIEHFNRPGIGAESKRYLSSWMTDLKCY